MSLNVPAEEIRWSDGINASIYACRQLRSLRSFPEPRANLSYECARWCRSRPPASTRRRRSTGTSRPPPAARPFFLLRLWHGGGEVAIDMLTGETRVLRARILQDVGTVAAIPAIDLGQIEGAFVQGMGWLTSEELWWDKEGRLRTHGPFNL